MLLFNGADHVVSLIHQGRVVVICCEAAVGKPGYYWRLLKDDHSWTATQRLTLPNYPADPSVEIWLGQHAAFKARIDYRYATDDHVPASAFDAVSDDRYVYLFRKAHGTSIYVDRFVFNETSLTLDALWQVRYQGSRERYRQSNEKDTLSYVDNDGKSFFEPTTELKIGSDLGAGAFRAVRVLSGTNNEFRWQIISFDATRNVVVVTSYGASADHPFDVGDKSVVYTDEHGDLRSLVIDGFAQSTIALEGLEQLEGAFFCEGPPGVTLYHVREPVKDQAGGGQVVVRKDLRMLIVLGVLQQAPDDAVSGCAAVFDLAVGLDGNLARAPSSIRPAGVSFGAKPLMSADDRGLTYAVYYLLSNMGMQVGPSLLESSDGFVHCTFARGYFNAAGLASQPLAMFYDTKNGWWTTATSRDSGGILNTHFWTQDWAQHALPPPRFDEWSSPKGAEAGAADYLVTPGGQLLRRLLGDGDWAVDPSAPATVQAVVGAKVGRYAEAYLIDGDSQLWLRILNANWVRAPHNAPAVVLAVSVSRGDRYLIDGDNQLWHRTDADWTRDATAPAGVVDVSGAAGSWYLIDRDKQLWYRTANARWSKDTHGPPPAARAVSGTTTSIGANQEEVWYLIDDNDQGWYRRQNQNWTADALGSRIVAASATFDGWHIVGDSNVIRYLHIDDDRGDRSDSFVDPRFAPDIWYVTAVEYGDVQVDDKGAVSGSLVRGSAFMGADRNVWFVNRRLAPVIAEFIGDMAVDLHLLGYIEGAAPVPAENMTSRQTQYEAMNTVKYIESASATRTWVSSRDAGADLEANLKIGPSVSRLSTSYGWLADSQIATSQTLVASSQVELGGNWDDTKGRFVPRNEGAALVSTAAAKVYALRFKDKPDTVVAYRYVVINPDSPSLEVLTFEIDPKYIRNGDLTSYRAEPSASDLLLAKNRQEKAREAYFKQYDANAFNRLPSLDQVTQTGLVASYSWSGDGFHSEEPSYAGSRDSSVGGSFSFLGMTGVSMQNPVPLEGPFSWSVKVMAGGHLNLSIKKGEASESTSELKTRFDGPKLDSRPKHGQVAAYSWKTFCTDQSVENFDTLFAKVIDRNWLSSDDATARKFVGMMKMRKPVWRILHRVTDIVPA